MHILCETVILIKLLYGCKYNIWKSVWECSITSSWSNLLSPRSLSPQPEFGYYWKNIFAETHKEMQEQSRRKSAQQSTLVKGYTVTNSGERSPGWKVPFHSNSGGDCFSSHCWSTTSSSDKTGLFIIGWKRKVLEPNLRNIWHPEVQQSGQPRSIFAE